MRTLIASDWHLGHYSSAPAGQLALTFLERANAAGDRVILNGDIFEGLFEPAARAEEAHPHVAELIADMAGREQLLRTEGNHDPGAGPPSIILEHECLGRVLVAHGHAADPIRRSLPGRFGDAISRELGGLWLVRGAARLAETAARVLAAERVEQVFSARCRAEAERAGCALGVFGHVHRQYLAAGDRYANAGRLAGRRLEFLALTRDGPELGQLDLADVESYVEVA